MQLGRFLEIAVHAPDVRVSLEFYESLGFVQATTGDVRNYPYGVVTDGHLCIGLHQREMPSPTLTWVLPDLVRHVPDLEQLGIEFEFIRLGDTGFNEVGFVDPSGQAVAIVEARTFSPPALPPAHTTALGYFEEIGIPTRELATAGQFWDRLGLVAFDPVAEPFAKLVAAGRDLNVGFYDVDLRRPVLTFSDAQMPAHVAKLRERGLRFEPRLPRGLDVDGNALLLAPEGTQLLLTVGE